MRAIVADRFGGPEVLRLDELPKPAPGPGEVLVRVAAAGVNPVDIQTRRGDYASQVPTPTRLGLDAAGTVVAVGPGVTALAAGDEVFYAAQALVNEGAYADYHVDRADMMARKPRGLSFAEAAAVPIAGQTAWDCLFERAGLRPAESVLILGGTGGIGVLAVQLARAAGAFVAVTCRADMAEFVRALGADATVDHVADPELDGARRARPGGFDVVLDAVGAPAIERGLGLLAPGGRLVSVVDQPVPHNLLAGWQANATLHLAFLAPTGRRLARLADLIERGRLGPVVERVLPLDRAAEAHRLIEAGRRRGKIVLDCS